MSWLRAAERLRAQRLPGVLVTVVAVRGHAPRDAGAKMLVAADQVWDTIGGGNLEESAIRHAREMLDNGARIPGSRTFRLSDKARAEFGIQCCGGDVDVLFEPLPVVPSVAVFGMGHVGWELARILSRHDIDLHLVDSRAGQLPSSIDSSPTLSDAIARVHLHHAPVPEVVLGEIPAGTQVLILTHDHAEDAALCDMALRCSHLGSIGLIGSAAKWSRFRQRLLAEGHPAARIDQIRCPIGLPGFAGKEPATIAVAVAAELVLGFEQPAGAAAAVPAPGADLAR